MKKFSNKNIYSLSLLLGLFFGFSFFVTNFANAQTSAACAGSCKSACGTTEYRKGSCPNRGTPNLCAPKTCQSSTPTTSPTSPAVVIPNSTTSCATVKGVCYPTCPSGSDIAGTCGSSGGNCCVPNGSTGTTGGATVPTAANNVQISFENPTDYDTVETFLDSVLGFMRNIVVILALVFLVIGALLYITSGGNDKRIGVAKAAITAALIGLAIVMVAPSFLKELAGVLGWNDLPSQASDALTLTEIATNVLNFLLAIIGVLAIIMFLVGAIMYLTSAGDEKRAGTGKSIVQSAIIGIIVAFSALVLVKQIAAFF